MKPLKLGWGSELGFSKRVWNFGIGWAYYGRDSYFEAYIGFGPFQFSVFRLTGLVNEEEA